MFTKFQLAAQYFPDQIDNAKVAVRHLIRWIYNTNGLLPALEDLGYIRTQHHFTPQQVRTIFDYLGEP